MTADVTAGSAFYLDYCTVNDQFLGWRDIVIARKQARKLFVQGNSFLGADGKVEWRDYEETAQGLITSWVERMV
jgi:dipeptidyl-peptidase-3